MPVITNEVPSCIMKVERIKGTINLGKNPSHHNVFGVAEVDLNLETPVMNKYSGILNKANKLKSSCGVKIFQSEKQLEFVDKLVKGENVGTVTLTMLQTAGHSTNKELYKIELKQVRIATARVYDKLTASNLPKEYQKFSVNEELVNIMSSDPEELDNKKILGALKALTQPRETKGIMELEFEYDEIIVHYYVIEPNATPRGHRSWGWNFHNNTKISSFL